MTILTDPPALVPASDLRARFAAAMSAMYQTEVPLYGRLLELVRKVNAAASNQGLEPWIDRPGLATERHGAIRLGTAAELHAVAKLFAVLGMEPVDYYDLAPAGLPVHSTAFRPIDAAGLRDSPFRVFTSLLRLELVEPASLRKEAEQILARRQIIVPEALALADQATRSGGLTEAQATRFIDAALDTFRWHHEANVTAKVYEALSASHRLLADVVSFRGPHINHLTPRVLDIDAAQTRMQLEGFAAKDVIEGPPRRTCPILLRQTSFKALEETIAFPSAAGQLQPGVHTARFGEIEQRGAALTEAGRARYDSWLGEGGMLDLPDDWQSLRRDGLAYFRYRPGDGKLPRDRSLTAMIDAGALVAEPILYEDFLPVSAAGIFRSNLGEASSNAPKGTGSDRKTLERAIGRPMHDSALLYATEEAESLRQARAQLGLTSSS